MMTDSTAPDHGEKPDLPRLPALDPDVCHRAVRGRDARFDGRFFTCVSTTGIFCRPICPARTPALENCQFTRSAAEALAAGYRPCLRCRPETAPGLGGWLGTEATVRRALALIAGGALDHGATAADLADRLGVGERHLRRLFDHHLGLPPGALARSRRLLLAKALLTDTDLPLTEVALAAGYGGLRRFQAAIRETYGRSPGDLRRNHAQASATPGIRLRLSPREPFDWDALRAYLGTRAIPGVEWITPEGAYARTLALGETRGRLAIARDPDGALWARLSLNRWEDLSPVVARIHALLDLDADPGAIAAVLGVDPLLAPRLAAHPGLRVPGAWDPFELAVRAILGQQISVAGARTLAGRLVERLGEPLSGDETTGPTHLFPTPRALANADLTGLGLTGARVRALTGLGQAVADDPSLLDPTAEPGRARDRLLALPGIGPWTVDYIALRAFRDPDAFPEADLGLLRALEGQGPWGEGRPSARQLRDRAEAWRPWRAYAALHLWTDP